MTYRHNAIVPVDPESLRPEPTRWQRFKIWFGCFINLTDHQWFRTLCGGTWVHASWYYADVVSGSSYYQQGGAAIGYFPLNFPRLGISQTFFPFQGPSKKNVDFFLCNWLPVLKLDDGREYIHYCHGEAHIWVMVDTEAETRHYQVMSPSGQRSKVGGGVMAPGTIGKYPYSLKISESCQFMPSVSMLLTDWPDYAHLKELGVVRKIK